MGESEIPKTRKTLTTVGDSQVKIGLSFHGLCSGSTTDPEEEQRELGHRGSTCKDMPLHSQEEHMDLRSVGPYISGGDNLITWGADFYSFRSKH